MNKRQRAVYELLMKKPKVKAFGFNKKELKGLAAQIAENLTSEEEASDEDVNAEIEKEVEAVLPVLEFGRSYANRVINDSRNGNEDDNDDDDDQDEDDDSSRSSKSRKSPRNKGRKTDEEPEWFKSYRESMEKKFEALSGERTADKRRTKLEKLLKDTGKFGERMLKSYARMSFKDDDEFDEFFAEVEEDLKSENQNRVNKGLDKLGAPATGGSRKKDSKPEVLSEDEIKEIARS